MVLTRLRVRVSYIILVIMRMGSGPENFSCAKKFSEVLTVMVGLFSIVVSLRLGLAYIGHSLLD